MRALGDGERVLLGLHGVSREGAITRVRVRGMLSLEEIRQLLAHYEAMINEQGFVLILMELHEASGLEMPGRRLASEWGGRNGHRVRSAVFGAPFVMRTAINLMNRAAGLLSGKAPSLHFAETYEEARNWLLSPERITEMHISAIQNR